MVLLGLEQRSSLPEHKEGVAKKNLIFGVFGDIHVRLLVVCKLKIGMYVHVQY